MLARIGLLALAAASSPSGCEKLLGDGSQNAHLPGAALGSFHVTAQESSNTCGPGALGAQGLWQFDVSLQRDQGVLYWNNGQVSIAGSLSSDDRSFVFDTQVIEDMRDPENVGLLPCSLARTDHASGKLDSAKDPVGSFTGDLSYTFTPTTGSSCEDLVTGELGDAPLFAALPCAITYKMTGSNAAADE
jgi:hypothetical protein